MIAARIRIDHHDIFELTDDKLDQADLLSGREFVAAVLLLSPSGFVGRQARFGIDMQFCQTGVMSKR